MNLHKSPEEIEIIRRNSQILLAVMDQLQPSISAGRTTREIDAEAARLLQLQGLESALLGYRGYSASICASVNDCVTGGVPSDRQLEEGDTLSLIVAIKKDGYHAKIHQCYGIGNLSADAVRLQTAAKSALQAAIGNAVLGNRVSDISHAIQSVAQAFGYGVVRELIGHGIGKDLHEAPMIPCFGEPGRGMTLRSGMVLQILVLMTETENAKVSVGDDEWPVLTADGCRACDVGHIVAVDEGYPQVLTRPPDHGA